MRHTIVLIAWETLRSGFAVSAAATATISMPPKAKATTSRPAAMPGMPVGMNPSAKSCAGGSAGVQPNRYAAPRTTKRTTKATLMSENQNSNSPKLPEVVRLIAVKTSMIAKAMTHWGTAGI